MANDQRRDNISGTASGGGVGRGKRRRSRSSSTEHDVAPEGQFQQGADGAARRTGGTGQETMVAAATIAALWLREAAVRRAFHTCRLFFCSADGAVQLLESGQNLEVPAAVVTVRPTTEAAAAGGHRHPNLSKVRAVHRLLRWQRTRVRRVPVISC
jgi:hypothetical protein